MQTGWFVDRDPTTGDAIGIHAIDGQGLATIEDPNFSNPSRQTMEIMAGVSQRSITSILATGNVPPTGSPPPNVLSVPARNLTPEPPAMSWASDFLSAVGHGGITAGAASLAGNIVKTVTGGPTHPPGAPAPATVDTVASIQGKVGPFSGGVALTRPSAPHFPGFGNPPDVDGSGTYTTGPSVEGDASGPFGPPDYNPVTGPITMAGPIGVTAPVQQKTCYRAPRGYSIVTMNGTKYAVLTKVAVALGLIHRRKHAAITARDVRGAKHVQNFIHKFSVHRTPRTPLKTHHRRSSR